MTPKSAIDSSPITHSSKALEREKKALDDICTKGYHAKRAEQYVAFCLGEDPPRLPNMAGFFRWMGLSAEARESFQRSHPDKFKTVKMIFEDEALNSPLPPSIVSAYMKQYFAATEDSSDCCNNGGITLMFEHDIEHDGE